tara:strand:- start:428 stop:721 length:294 start_codon:yes stop_codon:yes gene_type:complete
MTGITSELGSSKIEDESSAINQEGGKKRKNKSSKRMGVKGRPTKKSKRVTKRKPGKKTKKSPSKWIVFVKNFASKSKKSYMEALKDPKCKAEYHKKH